MKQFKHKCDFYVLQCTPDPLKGEKVNVGIVLRDVNSVPPIIRIRMLDKLRRVKALEPTFETTSLILDCNRSNGFYRKS